MQIDPINQSDMLTAKLPGTPPRKPQSRRKMIVAIQPKMRATSAVSSSVEPGVLAGGGGDGLLEPDLGDLEARLLAGELDAAREQRHDDP